MTNEVFHGCSGGLYSHDQREEARSTCHATFFARGPGSGSPARAWPGSWQCFGWHAVSMPRNPSRIAVRTKLLVSLFFYAVPRRIRDTHACNGGDEVFHAPARTLASVRC